MVLQFHKDVPHGLRGEKPGEKLDIQEPGSATIHLQGFKSLQWIIYEGLLKRGARPSPFTTSTNITVSTSRTMLSKYWEPLVNWPKPENRRSSGSSSTRTHGEEEEQLEPSGGRGCFIFEGPVWADTDTGNEWKGRNEENCPQEGDLCWPPSPTQSTPPSPLPSFSKSNKWVFPSQNRR